MLSVPPRLSAVLFSVVITGFAFPAHATHTAGERFFPALLVIDDPGIDDQASVHPLIARPEVNESDERETDFNFGIEKTITERLSLGIDDGYSVLNQFGKKHVGGWQDFATTLKYQATDDDEHELISSIGVVREWGGTGRESVGAERVGSTTPTVYFGKGFGRLSNPSLRPLAITGTLGFQVPDTRRINPYQLALGLSVQYSIPYLQKHGKNGALPDFVGRLTPLVEFVHLEPTNNIGNMPTKGTIAPGVIYTGDTYQIGIEALIPTTRASEIGVIAQFHFFFSDIFPRTLGKPIFKESSTD